MKLKFALILALALAMPRGPLHAGAVVGATEPTQILNNLQLGAQYVEQVQQTWTQINQYKTMLENLKQLTPSALLDQAARKLWADQGMLQAFRNLQKIVVGGRELSYSLATLDSRFKNLFPGYGNKINFSQSYRDWSGNTLNSVRNALSLITAHAENFDSEQGMVSELVEKSQSASGQIQALQAGNQISVAMVGQLQQLRQLQMAQGRAQADFIAAQVGENDHRHTNYDKIFDIGNERLKK